MDRRSGRQRNRQLNAEYSPQLREAIQALIDEGARIDINKGGRYWYPLSIATYGMEEIVAAVELLCSFRTTMWSKTRLFEQRFTGVSGTPEAVMVNSGSSADLLIAFAAVNPQRRLLSPGDEVLVPSVTWPTQIWSAMMAGLRVRFVDTDPRTLNIDLDDLRRKIGPATRAVFLVHLMGNPNDMDTVEEIRDRHDLLLFEDCCEALGSSFKGRPVGSFGTASAFSFFFSHHLTTMEGGMVCTDDPELSDLFRLLRAHGWARNTRYAVPSQVEPGLDPRYTFLNWGFNVRPTELQAAFGVEQLARLPEFAAARRRNVEKAKDLFQRHSDFLRLMEIHPAAECSWFALPIMLTSDCPFSKAEFLAHLESRGIETRPIVAGNLARQPVCQFFPELQGMDLPGADAVHDRGFYMGLYPVDSGEQLDRVAETFDEFIRAHA